MRLTRTVALCLCLLLVAGSTHLVQAAGVTPEWCQQHPEMDPRCPPRAEEPIPTSLPVNIVFNGVRMEPGVKPYEIQAFLQVAESRVYLPARALLQAAGYRVGFDAETRRIIATRDDAEIIMTIDSTSAAVNGRRVQFDVPPIIVGGRTMVPIRPVMEAIGARVFWDPSDRTVRVELGDGSLPVLFPYSVADARALHYHEAPFPAIPQTTFFKTPLGQRYFFFAGKRDLVAWLDSVSLIRESRLALTCIEPRVDAVLDEDGSFWVYARTGSEAWSVGSARKGLRPIPNGKACIGEFLDQLTKLLEDASDALKQKP